MIKNYSSYNFKSFKNQVSFDLIEDKNIDILKENIVGNYLKGLLFVGPNASGKTNSISTLQVLLDIVFGEGDISKYANIFNNDDMWMSYTFDFDGIEIYYKIAYIKRKKVIEEVLKISNKVVLERLENKLDAPINIDNNNKIKPLLPNIIAHFVNNKDKTFISFYNFLNNSVCLDLFNNINSNNNHRRFNPEIIYNNEILNEVNDFLNNKSFDFTLFKNSNESKIEDMFFIKNGSIIKMPFDMESIGNKTLIYILPIIINIIDNGGMLLLDEFGSGLHNELEELLVRYFMTNSKKSQLFMVSHSTNLLTNTLLRPDQIYSIDYTEEGSIAVKFSSENPRNTQNLEKMYLGGVFGGLPNYTNK